MVSCGLGWREEDALPSTSFWVGEQRETHPENTQRPVLPLYPPIPTSFPHAERVLTLEKTSVAFSLLGPAPSVPALCRLF